MNPAGLIDLLTFVGILVALSLLAMGWKRALARDTKLILVGLLVVTLFHSLSNVLEWSGISAALDPFEDYIELTEPMLWFLFIYSFLQQQVVKGMRESQARFRNLYDNAPSAYFSIGMDGRILRCNQRAGELIGCTAEELVGQPVMNLYADTPKGKEAARRILRRFREGEMVTNEELQMENVDGSPVWVSLTVNAIRDEHGQVVESRSMVVDITHRKQAEEALQRRWRELSTLYDVSQALSQSLNPEVIGQKLIEAMEQLLGYEHGAVLVVDEATQELVPLALSDQGREDGFLTRDKEYVRGKELHVGDGIIGWVTQHGQPVRLGDVRQDPRYLIMREEIRSELCVPLIVGKEVIGALNVETAKLNAYDADDERLLTALAGSAAVAIKNARLYEQTQQLAAFNESVVTSMFEGVLIEDADGIVTFANPVMVELLGREIEELLGQPWTSIVPAEHQSTVNQETSKRIEGTRSRYETVLTRKDGVSVPVIAGACPLFDEGRFTGVLSVFTDITDRKRAEEEKSAMEVQLRQSQKLESIGTLASGVAHEINNPLTGVLGYAEIIHHRIQDDELKGFAAGIMKEGKRVAKIVKDLLSFARQEKESHSPAQIKDIVESSLSLIGAVLRKEQITLELEISDDLPKVKCRSQQIQQVIINLLTNARDALNQRYEGYHEDKVVKIQVRLLTTEGIRWLRTTVEDHGTGIPQEVVDRIFDPFFTTKPRDTGTGLGLSVSYGIIREHHGELTVESEPGKYTRFHVDLRVDNGWSLKGSGIKDQTESDSRNEKKGDA